MSIDVMPEATGPDAYVELLLTLSMRPATGGRPAGPYQVSYRLGGSDQVGYSTSGILGIVRLDDPAAGVWTTVSINPVADVALLWPDLVAPEDNALYDIVLRAVVRNGASAQVFVDNLVMNWNLDWATSAALQEKLMSVYAADPGTVGNSVSQYRGLEVSWFENVHVNWFGLNSSPPPEPGANLTSTLPTDWTRETIGKVHARAGIASYNHPYGTRSSPVVFTDAKRAAIRAAAAASLVPSMLFGADILEVGMVVRAGMTFADHLWLWDLLTRNGSVVTGTGVSDDHTGKPGSWSSMGNRFLTYAWASSAGQGQLLAALRAGRCFVADPVSGITSLDIVIDAGVAVMGQVLTAAPQSRTLTILASGVPAGATVTLVQIPVDGASLTDPGSQIVASLPGTALVTGSQQLALPITSSWRLPNAAYRVEVADASGRRIAFSQPTWLVASTPLGAGISRLALSH